MFRYLLILDDYILGTPDCINQSDRTQDISAQALAQDYDLQSKMRLASAVFIRPDVSYAQPAAPNELLNKMAAFLADFKTDKAAQDEVRDYLMGDGMLRILWLK